METQKERIDCLMKKKNIKTYSDLHRMILNKLHEDDVYNKIEKGKANFSNMIKGERHFKFDYIIPLEEILETTYSYICNGTGYNPEFVNKGIRFAAFQNSYKDFENLDSESTKYENPIFNSDEFGKTIVDYILEYNALEGLRYLSNKYNLKYNHFHNIIHTEKHSVFISKEDSLRVQSLICRNDDEVLFNKIFDIFQVLEQLEYYDKDRCIFFDDEFKQNVLSSSKIFNDLLDKQEIPLDQVNRGLYQEDDEHGLFVNPMVNILLNYCLLHSEEYKKEIVQILKYAKEFNKEQIDKLQNDDENCKFEFKEETGIVKHGRTIYGNLIVVPKIYNPKITNEINILIDEVNEINEKLNEKNISINFGKNLFKRDDKFIFKKHSTNQLEYELYDKFAESNITGLLKFKSTEYDIDKFETVEGNKISYKQFISEKHLESIARFLREFHEECKLKFNGKVCLNNNLILDNIIFKEGEVTAIVDWSKSTVADKGLNDVFQILTRWTNITERTRDISEVLTKIKIVLTEYFKDKNIRQIGDKYEQYLLNERNKITPLENIYEYENISWALTFVEIFKDEIDEISE